MKTYWFSIIGWMMLFGFFFSVGNYFQSPLFAFYQALFDTVMLLIMHQFTVRLVFPKYFNRKIQRLIVSIIVILCFSVIYFLIDYYLMPHKNIVSFEKPPVFFHFFRMLMFTSLIYFIGTSISLIEHNNRLIENKKLLTEEKLSTELKLLKAQINPHFIFNALNNIFSLTYTKAENAPDAVLKLSEMLRYVFYDCGKEYVQVSNEVKYIENYIGFQQMKSEFMQNIKLSSNLKSGHKEIAPMLFIPFIENAFKYSRIEENEDECVDISIQSDKDKISFTITNGFDENTKPSPGNGIGIENVKHRLEILYPQKFDLNITDGGNRFTVKLLIFV